MPEKLIDGNWFDMATIAVAVFYSGARCLFSVDRRTWEAFGSDLSYGLVLLPMILLSCTAFSSIALDTLQNGNRVIISLAGLFSLIVVLRRTFESPYGSTRKRK